MQPPESPTPLGQPDEKCLGRGRSDAAHALLRIELHAETHVYYTRASPHAFATIVQETDISSNGEPHQKSEKVLIRSLLRALSPGKRESTKSALMQEVDCYLGVADIVVVRRSRVFWSHVTRSQLRCLTLPGPGSIYGLLLESVAWSPAQLARRAGLTEGTVKRHLVRLSKVGLAVQGAKGGFVATVRFPHESLQITAYEAKIENWRRALYQALRYWSFANQVYIVLPVARARRIASSEEILGRTGVGLIGLDGSGKTHLLLKSAVKKPRSSAIRLRVAARGVLALQRSMGRQNYLDSR